MRTETHTRQRQPGGAGVEIASQDVLAGRSEPITTGSSLYRARTTKRERRTRDQVEQLDQQILDVLREDHPQSVRHVFYRMTNPRLPEPVEKSDRGYRAVQHRTVQLRRSGRLPYAWLTDATRMGYFTTADASGADFIRRMAGEYRADLWRDSPYRCEVWCESRSIAGVILDDCRELGVSLYPSGGFTSLSFAHEAAGYINAEDDGRPLIVYYIGDYDPAGVLIDRKIEEELREHLRRDVNMEFFRIAINEGQIAEYDLPTKPRKESERRSLGVNVAVEAEAMPSHILRKLLRRYVESLLPAGALHATKVAEESERDGLLRLAAMYQGGMPDG